MIFGLLRKNPAADAVFAVYSALVAQSRQPRFYAEWGVPDSVTGRFDMICLHVALLFRRLRGEGKVAADFGQAVFDLFFKDMDRSLREMGVGDLSVPKKIKKMGSAFYGLLASVDAPIAHGDAAALEAVLVRNIYDGQSATGAGDLAAYLLTESARLASLPTTEILAGRVAERAAA